MTSRPGTITCFLCGGTHIYPGPRYEAHLQNEHGAIFDIDFLISVSLHKQTYSSLPLIAGGVCDPATTPPRSTRDDTEEPSLRQEVATQTLQTGASVCSRCETPYLENGVKEEKHYEEEEEVEEEEHPMEDDTYRGSGDYDDSSADLVDLPRHFLHVSPRAEDEAEAEEERDVSGEGETLACWVCPICPMVYKRHSYFKQHLGIAHEIASEDVGHMTSVELTLEEFQSRQQAASRETEDCIKDQQQQKQQQQQEEDSGLTKKLGTGVSYAVDKAKRKVVGKEWAPNSFSSRFTCLFCAEQFRKDYKLKLHLMMAHKDQPAHLMETAKEELIKAKLDGCVHRCGLCGNKYNSIANFTRHIKDVHSLSRAQYKMEYGGSEVISRMFLCELCNKEVKHTRNIIGAHMKMVHLISWKEYQDIILKLKSGEGTVDLPNPELFDCIICGVSVKYKREHLNKKHQLDEDVYEELIAKKARGEDISADLPEREVYTCNICERECMDFKRHLLVCHKLTEDQYKEEFCGGQNPTVKIVKQDIFSLTSGESNTGQGNSLGIPGAQNKSPGGAGGVKRKRSKKERNESEMEEPLSTDLQCYFQCEEVFKKDYQLHLHLKLRHRDEDQLELEKAYEAANEEIALTRRSASLFSCALCPRVFNDNGAFYGHIQNKHDISYMDYKKEYGRCETESQPFECKICGKVVKYDRNTVHTHLKNVHGINWTKYLDRIRAVRRGIEPEPLPILKMVECRVCNVSVKYLKEHLRNAHKITEQEYMELFSDDKDNPILPQDFRNEWEEQSPAYKRTKLDPVKEKVVVPKEEPLEPMQEVDLTCQDVDLRTFRPPKADIQDKSNKTCSVCKVTFDVRKSFIEHCQLIHRMKFKTKSGLSIPPPTSNNNLSEDGMTTTASSNTPSYQTAVVSEMSVQGTGDRSEENLDKPSRWNQCSFQCKVCSRTSNSRAYIANHIVDLHGISFKEYRAQYPDLEIVSHWFGCRLCTAKIKFTKEAVSGHLKLSHGMDLAMYETHYMEEHDWPHTQDTHTLEHTPSRRESASHSVDSESLGGELVIAEVDPFLETGQGRDSAWNRCQFQCSLCEATFSDRRNMKSHAMTSHRLSYPDYLEQYGDPEVPTAKWVCAVCGSETRHARNNIYIHLRDCHSMTCEQYATQYGFPGYTSQDRHQDLNSEAASRSCTPVTMRDTTQFSSKWNKCRFICHICNKIANEKRHIRSHTLQVHGTSLDVLEAEHGDCEVHTEYFFCAECHAEVKHCHRNVLMHLQRSHNMNTQEYEAKYGEMDGVVSMEHSEDGAMGQHFLITDNTGNLLTPPQSANKKRTKQSFTNSSGKTVSASGRLVRGTGDVPCENCGRMFSSHSNKERHKREHCHKYQQLGNRKQEAQEVRHCCPMTDCQDTFVKSVHVKRHLASSHGVSNPLQWMEEQGADVRAVMAGVVDLDEEDKIPPLRIKLPSPTPGIPATDPLNISDALSNTSQPLLPVAEISCDQCDWTCFNGAQLKQHKLTKHKPKSALLVCQALGCNFQSKNSFIFDRHSKAHEKRNELPRLDVNSKLGVRQRPIVSSESEDDSEDDQVEIIDERTIARGDQEEEAVIVKLKNEPTPIGVIINESTEDGNTAGTTAGSLIHKQATHQVSNIKSIEEGNDPQLDEAGGELLTQSATDVTAEMISSDIETNS